MKFGKKEILTHAQILDILDREAESCASQISVRGLSRFSRPLRRRVRPASFGLLEVVPLRLLRWVLLHETREALSFCLHIDGHRTHISAINVHQTGFSSCWFRDATAASERYLHTPLPSGLGVIRRERGRIENRGFRQPDSVVVTVA